MIGCGRALRWILASRGAELGLDRRLELDQHLSGCAACRDFDAQDALLEEALAALPEPPIEQLDVERLVRGIRGQIAARESATLERARRASVRIRRLGFGAAAAVLLVAGWRGLGASRAPDSEPTVFPRPEVASSAAVGESDRPATTPEPEETPADAARREQARAQTRAALATALERLPEASGPEGWLAPVDEALRPLREQGWPVTRLVERLVSDPDPRIAAIAARWLGLRGDRLSLGVVAGILDRPGGDAQLRRQSLLALCDAGEPAREELAPALEDPALRPLALQALQDAGGTVSVELVSQALAKAVSNPESAGELASALASMGPMGLDALLESAAQGGGPSAIALRQLRRTRGAREHVASALSSPGHGRDLASLLGVAAQLGLSEALAPLARRCLQREQREEALAALAAFEGSGALGVLLDLWRGGRLPGHEVLPAARAALERDPLEAPVLVEALEGSQDSARMRDLLDLLLHLESSSAGQGLARLAASPVLERDEREWAALAVGMLGHDGEAAALADLLGSLAPEDARLAAACLVSIHLLGGPPAVRAALGSGAAQRAELLVELLARRPADRNQAVTLSKAARLLEPWLDPRNPQRPRTAP